MTIEVVERENRTEKILYFLLILSITTQVYCAAPVVQYLHIDWI